MTTRTTSRVRRVRKALPLEALWRLGVNLAIRCPLPRGRAAGELAARFGLVARHEVLYQDFRLTIRPGKVVAVVGPSGAGKTMLLRRAARLPGAVPLAMEELAAARRPAMNCLRGGTLAQRLEVLSRCGLAEPAALLTPARRLSGGQRYRLALAMAVWRASRRRGPALVLADELAGCLDRCTAWALARQIRILADRLRLAFLLATPHDWLLSALEPDRVVVKPLCQPPYVAQPVAQPPSAVPEYTVLAAQPAAAVPHDPSPIPDTQYPIPPPDAWPIRPGTIADYRALAWCHYLAGPPAAHLRVWAIDAPPALASLAGAPAVAAVCVISPPVPNVRARNLAFPGRYTEADKRAGLARLNAEVECISRVVVHPVYRGMGLAVRLVRHALATRARPTVEALAAMGTLHPLFERAGMTALRPPPSRHVQRLASAAELVGLRLDELAAPAALARWLAGAPPEQGRFLRRELDRFARRAVGDRALARLRRRGSDPLPAICRKAAAGYVYYYHTYGAQSAPTTNIEYPTGNFQCPSSLRRS